VEVESLSGCDGLGTVKGEIGDGCTGAQEGEELTEAWFNQAIVIVLCF
jgi:hypothetical protein